MDSSAANSTMEPVTTRSLPPARAFDAPSKSRPSLLAALRKPATGSSESASESESDGSVSEDEPITTTANTTLPTTAKQLSREIIADEQEEESDDEAAYERMKKRLAASKMAAEAPKALSEPSTHTPATDSEDDEMPVRMNGRRSTAKQLDITSPKGTASSDQESRHSSPGLFVTPNASPVTKKTIRRTPNDDSESDSATQSPHNADLQERIQRIRAERLARQQEEGEQQVKSKKISRRRVDQASGSDTDGENGRRLTQQAKPTRKAGKKALEAMARDQQRISRNMQLAHQAKTKKRYTTKDLFARLGFNAPHDEVSAVVQLPTPGASSALTSSDAEGNQARETPPTSPPRQGLSSPKPTPSDMAASRTSVISPKTAISDVPLEKGKGRADLAAAMVELSDSEDEPALVQPKSRFAVFDRLPARKEQESASLLHLRSLAQLRKSPPKAKKGQKQVSLAEMEFSLAQKARQQAQQEREEKIAELRRRGHVIETEEEREKAQMQIEDMVVQFEKQRQEDLKLSKLERSEAKKNGETIDDLPSSDESDEDYVGSGNEREDEEHADDEDEVEFELSGSEDEAMGSDGEAEDDVDGQPNALVGEMAGEDEEAEVDDASGPNDDADEAMDDEDMVRPQRKSMVSKTRNRAIVVDDDDETSDSEVPKDSSTQPATQDDAMAAFGFAQPNDSLGLTQMFAGTMANLESQSTSQANPEQDSFDFLRNLPDTQPGAFFTQASDSLVPNSQSLMSPQKDIRSGASQFSLGISQLIETSPAFSRTQLEDFEPTQDAGFSFSRSPAGLVAPTSTVDTVMMSIMESPVKERKGKLQRGRKEATVELSDVEENSAQSEADLSEDDIQRPPKPRDAFLHMKKGAKKQKALEEFNKKTSMAKDAVMEQAEESEDEYAGIGGASDDEEGEEDEYLKEMIDHNDVKVDERQLAAFYADKAKKDDAKNIAELYKKIQTGGLRRQAGGRDGFDMSDSEDEVERRQRRKQAEFQKNVKALLKDDRVMEISKDEKKKAFFNTLADFADEGDYDFLDVPAEMGMDIDSQEDVQQSENTEEVIPDSQADAVNMPAPSNPLKRKSPDSQKENRPPPNLRRTAASDTLMARKPITLADVQHSVSELLEDPHIMVPDSQYSESEDDESPAPSLSSRKPIIDRLTLSRTSTASDSSHTDNGNVAFHAPSRASAAPGFRVPSLIRRATSNISTASERSSSTTKTASDSSGVRRGGTGRSNIHAQAREAERRALLDKKDGKRKEALRKKVEGGRKRAGGIRSVLGSLGGGFE